MAASKLLDYPHEMMGRGISEFQTKADPPMTKEMHAEILRFALSQLLLDPAASSALFAVEDEWDDLDPARFEEWLRWALANPVYPDPEHERVKGILTRAAAWLADEDQMRGGNPNLPSFQNPPPAPPPRTLNRS